MNQTTFPNVPMSDFHDGLDPASPERLASVDLNLLVAFDALARERSVTRAAARVGVTQSAMSHVLRRLRALLRDPVLVRGKAGMVLTPRAAGLVAPLRAGLVSLGRALAGPVGFTPATASRRFALATMDLFDVVVVPTLLTRVRREAPAVDLAVVAAAGRPLDEQLETGELDVAVRPHVDQVRPAGAPPAEPGLVRRTLARDGMVCFVRAGHPALAGRRRAGAAPLSLDVYAGLAHVLVSPTGEGRGLVDQLLERRGRRRRVALRIPQFTSALAIVAHSDLVLTAPSALARIATAEVVAVPPPLRLPGHTIDLVWHERFSKDPGHAWLRDLVVETARVTIPAA